MESQSKKADILVLTYLLFSIWMICMVLDFQLIKMVVLRSLVEELSEATPEETKGENRREVIWILGNYSGGLEKRGTN
jgi:hypothetical protein